jgi:preprotein translocase subunit SecD
VARPVTSARPLRLMVAMTVVIVGLAAWAFWPGTDHSIKLGLDLQGGTQITLQPKPVVEGATMTDDQLQQTVSILRQRVDGLGVAESEVTTQGSGEGATIVVSVPGLSQDRLLELVQRTALLDFRPVWEILSPASASAAAASASPSPSDPNTAASPSATGSPSPSVAASPSASSSASAATGTTIVQATDNSPEYQAELANLDCTNPEIYNGGTPDDPTKWLGTCEKTGGAKYNLQPAFIKGTNVTSASAVIQQNGVGWVVSLQFDSEGAAALADASKTLSALPECGTPGATPCNAFAIVLDGTVVSAPRFNEPILGGQAQIEGNFTAQEANDLASVLKYGALPVTLEPVDVTSISATVGNDQLRAGILAGLLGLVLVMLYLFIYYRVLGLAAIASLIVAGGVTYLALVVLGKTVGLTLTLAGVAGAIVAIGITADSFIVYFERIRDEIREGRSLRQACDSGWVRARRTLLAADFVSILAAVVLYVLSVGSVRGFAFVLGLTTVIDIIVAFWFAHPLVVLMGRSRWMQKGSRMTGLSTKVMVAPESSMPPSVAGARRREAKEGSQS